MTTRYACGIGLHARQMYVCVTDRDRRLLLHQNLRNNHFPFFFKQIARCPIDPEPSGARWIPLRGTRSAAAEAAVNGCLAGLEFRTVQ